MPSRGTATRSDSDNRLESTFQPIRRKVLSISCRVEGGLSGERRGAQGTRRADKPVAAIHRAARLSAERDPLSAIWTWCWARRARPAGFRWAATPRSSRTCSCRLQAAYRTFGERASPVALRPARSTASQVGGLPAVAD